MIGGSSRNRSNHLWDAECLQVVAATMLTIVGREAAGEPGAGGQGSCHPNHTFTCKAQAWRDRPQVLHSHPVMPRVQNPAPAAAFAGIMQHAALAPGYAVRCSMQLFGIALEGSWHFHG